MLLDLLEFLQYVSYKYLCETDKRKRGVVSGGVRGRKAANSCVEIEDAEKERNLASPSQVIRCQDQNTDEKCTIVILGVKNFSMKLVYACMRP